MIPGNCCLIRIRWYTSRFPWQLNAPDMSDLSLSVSTPIHIHRTCSFLKVSELFFFMWKTISIRNRAYIPRLEMNKRKISPHFYFFISRKLIKEPKYSAGCTLQSLPRKHAIMTGDENFCESEYRSRRYSFVSYEFSSKHWRGVDESKITGRTKWNNGTGRHPPKPQPQPQVHVHLGGPQLDAISSYDSDPHKVWQTSHLYSSANALGQNRCSAYPGVPSPFPCLDISCHQLISTSWRRDWHLLIVRGIFPRNN